MMKTTNYTALLYKIRMIAKLYDLDNMSQGSESGNQTLDCAVTTSATESY